MSKSRISSVLTKASSIPVVSKAINKIGSRFYPPPYLCNDMEFMYGAWAGTSTLKGLDGRQLGEDNATPAFHREPTPTQYHVCKFGDSRDGKFFNMSALHDVMKNWNEVMILINTFRANYIEKFNLRYNKLTTFDLFIFSKLLVGISSFLVRSNHHEYENGTLPLILTSQHKLVAGVFMNVRKMIERGEQFLNDSEPADADFMYEYADKQWVLISPRDSDYACGGSVKKIKELIQITISGLDHNNSEINDEKLAQILANDYSKAFQYGILDLQMELILQSAQVSILELILASTKMEDLPQKNEILSFARCQFPCEYFDTDTLHMHKGHLKTLLTKLDLNPISLQNENSSSKEFSVIYLNYLDQIRTFCLNQQNNINHLLGIDQLTNFSDKKINKRLKIVPKNVFKTF